MWYPNFTASNFVTSLHIYGNNNNNNNNNRIAFSLEFASLRKISYSMLLLLLNRCKLSYFIGYRCLNLTYFLTAALRVPTLTKIHGARSSQNPKLSSHNP